jgi:hypothetical protein
MNDRLNLPHTKDPNNFNKKTKENKTANSNFNNNNNNIHNTNKEEKENLINTNFNYNYTPSNSDLQTPSEIKDLYNLKNIPNKKNQKEKNQEKELQSDFYNQKLIELENKINFYESENLKLINLKEEYTNLCNELNYEIDNFQLQKQKEISDFEIWKEEEIKKILQNKKLNERVNKNNTNIIPSKKDKEEIECLKNIIAKMQEEFKIKDQNNKITIDKLKRKNEESNVKINELNKILYDLNAKNSLLIKSNSTNLLNNSNNNNINNNNNTNQRQSINAKRYIDNNNNENVNDNNTNILNNQRSNINISPNKNNFSEKNELNNNNIAYKNTLNNNVYSNLKTSESVNSNSNNNSSSNGNGNGNGNYNTNINNTNKKSRYIKLGEERDNLFEKKKSKEKIINTKESKENNINIGSNNNNNNTHNIQNHITENLRKMSSDLEKIKQNTNEIYLESYTDTNCDDGIYDLIFMEKYHPKYDLNVNVVNHEIFPDGKIVKFYENNKREVIFPSRVRKEIFDDGYQIIYFNNKDIKQVKFFS